MFINLKQEMPLIMWGSLIIKKIKNKKNNRKKMKNLMRLKSATSNISEPYKTSCQR